MCVPSIIDEAGRNAVAALSARSGAASTSPFGPADEIGMLNLITSESRRRTLANIDCARVFDLAVDYFLGMPSWTANGDMPFQIWLNHSPGGTVVDDSPGVGRTVNERISYSGESIAMYTHCGTHIDTLCHWGYGGTIWNGFRERDRLGSRHWTVAGADKQPPIIARGVLLDVPSTLGLNELVDSQRIGREELEATLSFQGTELHLGDVVLIRTGRMRSWPNAERYLAPEPGLTLDGAAFLAEAGAIVIGADNFALEVLPPETADHWSPVHTYLLAECGVAILELAHLEELAAERVYEFAFVGACMRIRGATGAPIRPLAIPFRSA
jgi:kynurenine formamidase